MILAIIFGRIISDFGQVYKLKYSKNKVVRTIFLIAAIYVSFY